MTSFRQLCTRVTLLEGSKDAVNVANVTEVVKWTLYCLHRMPAADRDALILKYGRNAPGSRERKAKARPLGIEGERQGGGA